MTGRHESNPTPTAPDFGPRAARYDELRPTDDNWWEVYDALVQEGDLNGRRVLDVGSGTGRFAAALSRRARVWGVDESPQMLEVARERAPEVRFKEASAYALPFKDGWFDRATMWLVVHLLDRPRAYSEIRRVLAPGGRIAVATFDPSYFGLFWFRAYFPSMETIDRARFPTRDDFEAELGAVGFGAPRFRRISQRATVTREVALERIRGKHIATFDLIGEDEYRTGLERAEADLPDQVNYRQEWLITGAEAA
ncbi:MAG TPA: class I SAM-dependent methyltransferase [Gaiellaceae bacterium]|nr:class I SAM-dependent methyltransferase [Gaiellaceae bacterium]